MRVRFDDFVLDTGSRQLLRDGVEVALNARYFDALVLLLREHGQLVAKQRFFDEVWAGSVVTDAALTQCIKELRRALGDDAAAPRFVRTVTGHGYRFIAAVEPLVEGAPPELAARGGVAPVAAGARVGSGAAQGWQPRSTADRPVGLAEGLLAAGAGGSLAGLLGGLLYGSAFAAAPAARDVGTLSVLLVVLALCVVVGGAGALGVGGGIVWATRRGAGALATLAAAALGGLAVGGLTRLLVGDAFLLLVGRAPVGITGAIEGAVIGLAVAAGLHFAGGPAAARRRVVALTALSSGLAGGLLPLLGGSMMAGSLARLGARFDDSRLDVAALVAPFGGARFGLPAECFYGALEGAVFGGCLAAALGFARSRTPPAPR